MIVLYYYSKEVGLKSIRSGRCKMSPVSKTQQKAVAKYMKNNYDELSNRLSNLFRE